MIPQAWIAARPSASAAPSSRSLGLASSGPRWVIASASDGPGM